MKTSLQVLKLDDSPSLDDYKEVVSVMEQNIERLIDTVNDLLLLFLRGENGIG
jgi:signal transduction histidine kinase